MFRNKALCAAALALAMAFGVGQAHAADTKSVNVPAGDLTGALETLARQSGVELVYRPEQLKGLRTKGVQGTLSSEDAVKKLIEGTSLTLSADPSGVLLISAANAPIKTSETAVAKVGPSVRLSQAENPENLQKVRNSSAGSGARQVSKEDASAEVSDENSKGIPEIPVDVVVTGSRIKRPASQVAANVVVLSAEDLRATGEATLERALRQLPQNFLGTTEVGTGVRLGGMSFNGAYNITGGSTVNLRGLGSQATMVLVDGRELVS